MPVGEREQGRKWGGSGRGRLGLGLRGGEDGGGLGLGTGRQEGRVVEGSGAAAAQVLAIVGGMFVLFWYLHLLLVPLSGSGFESLSPAHTQHDLAGHMSSVCPYVKWE